MRDIDVLIAHPFRHHSYHLAIGIKQAGLKVRLATTFYAKGISALVAQAPTSIGRRVAGYHNGELSKDDVYSPIELHVKRLLMWRSPAEVAESFDKYMESKIQSRAFTPRWLVTMQDYMPLTVFAAKRRGIKLWSDQILNNSDAAQTRMAEQLHSLGVSTHSRNDNRVNSEILRLTDVVTAPSSYVRSGLEGSLPKDSAIYTVPYGVNLAAFEPKSIRSKSATVHVVARANDVRKGGHLLLDVLEADSETLLKAAQGPLRFTIVGRTDEHVAKRLRTLRLPTSVTVQSVIPPHADMPQLLASADLFLMPSLSEGMSLIAVEAMAVGVPLVLSDYCGLDCHQDGAMGPRFRDNVSSLSAAMHIALSSREKWEEWSQIARVRALELSWNSYHSSIRQIAEDNIAHQ